MKEKGATLLELITVVGVFSILFGIIGFSLFGSVASSSIQTSVTTLVADIKGQQVKAMSLETGGAAQTKDYGLYFSQNSYTLFTGSNYLEGDNENFVIPLGNNVEFFSVSIPNRTLVFTKLTGEVAGFVADQNTIILKNTQNNQTKTIQINKLGVITEAN